MIACLACNWNMRITICYSKAPSKSLSFAQGWISEYFIDLDFVDEIWESININGRIVMVSNIGRVQNKHRKTFGSISKSGYKTVNISHNQYSVHQLVIIAFKGNYDSSLVINHIDSNKSNNILSNRKSCIAAS